MTISMLRCRGFLFCWSGGVGRRLLGCAGIILLACGVARCCWVRCSAALDGGDGFTTCFL